MNEFLLILFGLCCVIGLIIAFKYATKIRHVSIDEYVDKHKLNESHCVRVLGWNDKTESYICQNCWGNTSDKNGIFEIPQSKLDEDKIHAVSCDSFEIFRGEALEFMHNRNKRLIENWCKSSGVTSPIGYYNDSNGVMTIYTTHPGWLIGKGGEKVDEFTNELEKEFNMKYTVKFVEIKGDFVNIL